jgi:uncharacterized protein YecE (DUF72 family)
MAVAKHAEKGRASPTELCERLNRRIRHAVEFRDPSWLDEEVFELLRRHGVANVALSSTTMPKCLEITAQFVYVRFHGAWLLVDPALPSGSPIEVLDRICYIAFSAIDVDIS